MPKITWHGHSTCTLETDGGTKIVIDPFFDDNPKCEHSVEDIEDVDFILVTHGHFDHFADCIPLAKRTGARVVSTFEIVGFCEDRGVENGHPMNIGGGYRFPFGYVKMTPALHSGSVAGDESGAHTTACGGFLIDFADSDKTFYHAGDTALIKDLELLRGDVHVAMLPIGDNFTMGPVDAVKAVEMIQPKVVIPIHYSTWDVIDQDPEEFRRMIANRARVQIMKPNATWEF
jgi:L-ascorbate metabolism protein UlaG (beta-lactamase superfamily)